MGDLVLQRRRMISLEGREIFEVRLGDDYLMSSLFHDAEVALADIGLGALDGAGWDVVVGGLGLGYTAAATLRFKQVQRLIVVEALEPVIDWHRQGLVPNGFLLTADPRCVYRHADFFGLARGDGFDPDAGETRFDAILLDIDHTPGILAAQQPRRLLLGGRHGPAEIVFKTPRHLRPVVKRSAGSELSQAVVHRFCQCRGPLCQL